MPAAERAAPGEHQRRVGAGLDGLTGRVIRRQATSSSVHTFVAVLRQVARASPAAERVAVVVDTWPGPAHPKVAAAVAKRPRLELVERPTDAPWLTPIEKRWGWLKDAALRQHGLAGRWTAGQRRVTACLARLADGSEERRRRVGLRGAGTLAAALTPSPSTALERQT